MNRGWVRCFSSAPKTGLKRSTWPTWRMRPLRAASSASSVACAVLSVIGFSTSTCLPLERERVGNLVVRIGGRCHGSGVNHSDEIIERFGRGCPEFARNRAAPERLQIVHRGELSRRNFRVKSCMIASDMPNTNNANAKLFHRSLNAVNSESFRGSTPEPFSVSRQGRRAAPTSESFRDSAVSLPYAAQFATNHSYVCAMPLRNGIVGCQPSVRILVTSNSFAWRAIRFGLVPNEFAVEPDDVAD